MDACHGYNFCYVCDYSNAYDYWIAVDLRS